jgi:predicted ribosome quality control (RQC) complex YloA/Tae2 family protein
MSWADALVGARVRRVDAPSESSLAIALHGKDLDGVLLVDVSQRARGVGWLDTRPPGRTQSPLLLRLKSCLEAGRVAAIEQPSPALLRLHVERAQERFVLEAALYGRRGNVLLRSADGAVLAAMHSEHREIAADGRTASHADAQHSPRQTDLDGLRAVGQRLLESQHRIALEQRRTALGRALRSELRRAQRRMLAIEGDLARASQVSELRHHASLVLAHLHALPRDCAQASVLDYTLDPPQPVELRFDLGLGPQRQADAWFRRARKLERGAALSTARAQATQVWIAALCSLGTRLERAVGQEQIEQLALEAREHGVAVQTEPVARGSAKPEPRLPYRQFKGAADRPILVGRGPEDNDRLTLDHTRPHDLWLHVRDEAGAHVVVPLERNEACPPDLLGDAATLAAHFSQARGKSPVDVVYTARRYVRKPRKAKPGLVALLREKVFRLQLEPPRLERLLKSESPH